jgi:AcrR family transcriptional regulator
VNSIAIAPKRPRPSTRQLRRQLDILAAAREELTEKGYDGVTMEALAERAGVVKKTLYNLYGSKDDLLMAAIAEIIDGYRGQAATAERGIPAIIASRRAASRQIVVTPEYAEAMTKALAQADPAHRLVRVLLGDSVASHITHLEVARANGELEPGVDVPELAEQLTSQGWGLILLWMKGLVPLAEFESRSLRGMIMVLLAVTRGVRRRELQDLLNQTTLPQRGGQGS